MREIDRKKADAELRAAFTSAVDATPGRRFRVVLEGVKGKYETYDSFAIKFGIATNQPVTKVKHILRSLPSVVWEGENPTMAAGLLSMLDEAGGQGRLDEVAPGPARSPNGGSDAGGRTREDVPNEDAAAPEEPPASGSCPKCGFPAGEEERYCQFCMSPFEKRRKSAAADKAGIVPAGPPATIPPKRLLLYVCIVLLALVVHILLI